MKGEKRKEKREKDEREVDIEATCRFECMSRQLRTRYVISTWLGKVLIEAKLSTEVYAEPHASCNLRWVL